MAAKASVRIDQAALRRLLTSQQGPVAAELTRRAIRVQNDAKRRCPVDTGRLRSSVSHELRQSTRGLLARVGTNVSYALDVHEGTGIYGPRRRPIRPKRAKVLRFKGRGGRIVYTKQVKGMRPRPFLRDALGAARN